VTWVLDADIRKFFDSVNHDWLMRMLRLRIADRRILALIEGWLRAGVLENGIWSEMAEGTPQGSGISPLLANVFLHYILDLWVNQWRKNASGLVSIVRYCDDFVMCFEKRVDAEQMQKDLEKRFEKFGLALHKEKTRLIPFGRFGKTPIKPDGTRDRLPTFDFLGFTHYCSTSLRGRFVVKRKTQGKRMIRKLKEIRAEMRDRRHETMEDQHRWLSAVLRGHYRYYGLPANSDCLMTFTYHVRMAWIKTLRRRGGKHQMSWDRLDQYLNTFPFPRPSSHRPPVVIIRA
jgi:group II intron reverse transcriptase/maturase